MQENIHTLASLTDRTGVFQERNDAGRILAGMLPPDQRPVVVAIPSGGVPVAIALCRQRDLPLKVAPVSKVTLPWNTEAGCGAVAFDMTVGWNEQMIRSIGLPEADRQRELDRARQKVVRRVEQFGPAARLDDLAGREILLVDDGLASGFTMHTALEALFRLEPTRLDVAVPTAHQASAERIAREVDALYCANLRSGGSFAVAGAYRNWHDVAEIDAIRMAEDFKEA